MQKYQRKGHATIVTKAFVENASKEKMKAYWDSYTKNIPSIKTALKIGYSDPLNYQVFEVYWKK